MCLTIIRIAFILQPKTQILGEQKALQKVLGRIKFCLCIYHNYRIRVGITILYAGDEHLFFTKHFPESSGQVCLFLKIHTLSPKQFLLLCSLAITFTNS